MICLDNAIRKVLLLSFCLIFAFPSICYSTEIGEFEQLCKDYHITEQHSAHDDVIVKCERASIRLDKDIQSFDVSDNRIVICFSNGSLGIFDEKMHLIDSFWLQVPSKTCGVIINGDNIVLVTNYNGHATEITQQGDFVRLYEIPEQWEPLIAEKTLNNTREQNGVRYYISTDNTIPKNGIQIDVPYLLKETENGQIEVLYDASEHHKKTKRLTAMAVLCFLVICGIVAYLQYGRQRKEEKGEWVFKE